MSVQGSSPGQENVVPPAEVPAKSTEAELTISSGALKLTNLTNVSGVATLHTQERMAAAIDSTHSSPQKAMANATSSSLQVPNLAEVHDVVVLEGEEPIAAVQQALAGNALSALQMRNGMGEDVPSMSSSLLLSNLLQMKGGVNMTKAVEEVRGSAVESKLNLTTLSPNEAAELNKILSENLPCVTAFDFLRSGEIVAINTTAENIKNAKFLLYDNPFDTKESLRQIIPNSVSENEYEAIQRYMESMYRERNIPLPPAGIPPIVLSIDDWSDLIIHLSDMIRAQENNVEQDDVKSNISYSHNVQSDLPIHFNFPTKKRNEDKKDEINSNQDVIRSERKRDQEKAQNLVMEEQSRAKRREIQKEEHEILKQEMQIKRSEEIQKKLKE